MDKEYTIIIEITDLQALYSAYLMEYYGNLQARGITQKDLVEQKKRIDEAIREALEADGNK